MAFCSLCGKKLGIMDPSLPIKNKRYCRTHWVQISSNLKNPDKVDIKNGTVHWQTKGGDDEFSMPKGTYKSKLIKIVVALFCTEIIIREVKNKQLLF